MKTMIDVSGALPRLAFPRVAPGAEVAAKLAACRLAGLTVPDEVAVIGVHNDELLCELCAPPLSRVIPNGQRAGYEAAALLRRAMTGKPLRVVLHEIAPLGVASRQSTDVAAVGDVKIAGVVRFMRERAATGANVSDVLRAVPMARTALERRFKAALGTTPHAQLRKLPMERVEELLVGMTLPVGGVVAATGFENPEYLSAMFRRECGLSPREFMARHGGEVGFTLRVHGPSKKQTTPLCFQARTGRGASVNCWDEIFRIDENSVRMGHQARGRGGRFVSDGLHPGEADGGGGADAESHRGDDGSGGGAR